MTRKEELIIFIDTINEEIEKLKVFEKIITSSVNSALLNDDDLGYKTFKATNEHLVGIITEGFNDDLVGNYGTDTNLIKILEWFKENKI